MKQKEEKRGGRERPKTERKSKRGGFLSSGGYWKTLTKTGKDIKKKERKERAEAEKKRVRNERRETGET
jgi:hypothetical protein